MALKEILGQLRPGDRIELHGFDYAGLSADSDEVAH